MRSDQLSQTAAFVAIKFHGLTKYEDFNSLFDDSVIDFYDKLVQALPAPLKYYHFWLRFRWIRRFYIWSEELFLPGDLLHVVARKWQIQQMTNQLVDQGFQQIIVLGAGFDHTAHYYQVQGLSCFEFDTPYMVKRKKQFLNEYYPDAPHPEIISAHLPNVRLGTQFSEQQNIDPGKKTIIIAEGFFDYLTPDLVASSLRQINTFFSNKQLIGTHFALDELSKFHRWIFKNSVRMVGEQLEFNTSAQTFKNIVQDEGFNRCKMIGSHEISKELYDLIETRLPILKGFYLFRAES